MTQLTRDDVLRSVGHADDVTIARIIASGATVAELAEAQAWLANDEPLINAGRPLATGRARELVDILSELEPSADDEPSPPIVPQE
ncbi:hypothetical protein ABIF38_002815 [Bradyrhizobium japonicum]|jgi:hypothetical protein|uniref:DUF3572 family protein n=1 Tax=Bradyrhizobium elkanii TaxID=29448 RepID=A0ABV4FBK7_BRAEL|nr:hypothetical protein [Bradyrhizobium elkanii]MBP2432054.1 hypothetical protein [Bradyrhizobium elkanii]MCP1734871.1 hypothetical protein [Bradyrhizobium elkanii]MCP1752417.1 hypothetical protein [Bradyrhizobium elkanii]MCP1975273.1 hypothetical protein [Bradyrhizobium elkanii]MCP1978190.1 hypothetical protein [Bradyrhizobium elkanii]